jgi:hypothetical protein
MRRSRFLAILLIGLLSSCLSDTREQLQQCTAAASARYPSAQTMPLGEPYKDILACMQEAGYAPDYEGPCGSRDYTSIVTDPYCYRPSGAIKGYFHDVSRVLR